MALRGIHGSGGLFASFSLFTGFLPAGDASGKVLDVGVAEGLGLFGGGGVGIAARATTIGDDEGGLVLGKFVSYFVTGAVKVDGGRHVAGFPGVTAVDVDNGDFLVIDGFLEIGDADIGEFTGEDVGGEEEAEDQGE